MRIQPVILCGGAGSRLWPLSRPDRPKQFASLVGDLTTYQLALVRLRGDDVAPPIVVSSPDYRDLILRQAAAVGLEPDLILEPEMRDSAPAIAAAAAYVRRNYPQRTVVVQPADHQIRDLAGFGRTVARAVEAAAQGAIVTFGIPPTFPSTAFGYIKPGAAMEGVASAAWVERFVEKPALPVAKGYLRDGYYWNSGIFIFKTDTFDRELRLFAPDLAQAADDAVTAGRRIEGALALDKASFARAPKRSIDYALLEHTRSAAVVPATFDWSDLGTWPSLKEVMPADGDGNVLSNLAFAIETRNSLVHSEQVPVVLIGVENLSVIVEPDVVLICADAAAPQMKAALDAVKAAGRSEALRCSSGLFRYGRPAGLAEAAWRLRRWLDLEALPLWSSFGIDYAGFGFHEALDADARPQPGPRRFRVQPRQLFVFASAGLAGWPGPWQAAVAQGLRALLGIFSRPDGLFHSLVDGAGQPLGTAALLYDQAFGLLGLAMAAKAGQAPRAEMEARALACLKAIEAQRRTADGSYAESDEAGLRVLSNPLMHLLEAALLWEEVGEASDWTRLADAVVTIALARFVDPDGGFLCERTDSPGNLVEPGHQFEWAWLLSRWAERRGDAAGLVAARRLYQVGRARGIDPARNVALDSLNPDLSVHSAQARLWPQTERLKAALGLARLAVEPSQRAELEADALMAAAGLAQYLDTSLPGLWRDKLRANGTFVEETAPASSFYHIIQAILDLERYSQEQAA